MSACFLECIQLKRLYTTFTESDHMFVYSISYFEIFLLVLVKNLSHSHKLLMKILASKLNIFNPKK